MLDPLITVRTALLGLWPAHPDRVEALLAVIAEELRQERERTREACLAIVRDTKERWMRHGRGGAAPTALGEAEQAIAAKEG